MNNLFKITSLILVTLLITSCDEIKTSQDYFLEQEDKLNQLIINNPDSADVELTHLIKKYPKKVRFLELRISLYIKVNQFKKAKEDYEKLILLDPFYKESKTEILEYLDCKILTKGDCGDSLEEVYTITISEDINMNNDSSSNVEEWDIDTNFLVV